ncbi:HAMP domain-containing sensor histidine kinase [Planococcus sp. APC 4015]|nr:HAMP domain-containing sensor histidine kinase [Planococcus sp. APC 4015]
MNGVTNARRRGLSVRSKLALSYAGFLVVAGIALFAVGFLLLRFVPEGNLSLADGGFSPDRSDLLEVFVRYAWWALALLLVFGLGGGWLLAGLVLRPLARVTDAARDARDGSLDHRVALQGRRDEITDLADTFDAMLDRIAQTIDEERRFTANASHELRTPHAIIRTMVEVAQADPVGRDVDVLLQRIASTNDRGIATTEALLVLAQTNRATPLPSEHLDLAALVADAVEEHRPDAATRGIRIDTALDPAHVAAHEPLIARAVANLLQNAIAHNVEGGWVRVQVVDSEIVVVNGGPRVDVALAATLTEPFVRGPGRTRPAGEPAGTGLGLAIVASIVRAHDGELLVTAPSEGGLHVRIALPR